MPVVIGPLRIPPLAEEHNGGVVDAPDTTPGVLVLLCPRLLRRQCRPLRAEARLEEGRHGPDLVIPHSRARLHVPRPEQDRIVHPPRGAESSPEGGRTEAGQAQLGRRIDARRCFVRGRSSCSRSSAAGPGRQEENTAEQLGRLVVPASPLGRRCRLRAAAVPERQKRRRGGEEKPPEQRRSDARVSRVADRNTLHREAEDALRPRPLLLSGQGCRRLLETAEEVGPAQPHVGARRRRAFDFAVVVAVADAGGPERAGRPPRVPRREKIVRPCED
mmetsp:Transcript_29221/g.86519  ORF Transcript_29221/g.86519 Transcript_29221/m.86519 type:complete len:275 (-) Transcript_29221:1674-2498(-)